MGRRSGKPSLGRRAAVKSDLPAGGLPGRSHQLANRLEDHPELAIVPSLQLVETTGQFTMGGKHLAKMDERADDLDARLNRYRAVERSEERRVGKECRWWGSR